MADQQTDGCAAAGALTEHHEGFAPFAGTFTAEVKMWMGPGEPMVMTGTMTNELDLGGRFLRQHFVGDGADGPFGAFEGRGFWGYNTATETYEGVWLDTAATMMHLERGTRDKPGVWTMRGEMTNPQDGSKLSKRTVIELKDNDRHSMTTYFAGPDGNEHKSMEITYVRA